MDYGALLSRAWNLIWDHKFLILLGVLVALGSGSGSGAPSGGINLQGARMGEGPLQMPEWRGFEDFRIPPLSGVLIITVIGLVFILGLAVWVISTVARGGLIAAADTLAGGAQSSFGSAFSAGWARAWTLLGIAIVPGIPAFLMLLGGLFVFLVLSGMAPALGESIRMPFNVGVLGLLGLMGCILMPIIFVLSLLRTLANRAAMLEGLGVFAAYRRGVTVLFDNIGSALILFFIQVALNIGLGLIMILPSILLALCCILWPLLLLVQGGIAAYFSTLWTLAWREWTSAEPSVA